MRNRFRHSKPSTLATRLLAFFLIACFGLPSLSPKANAYAALANTEAASAATLKVGLYPYVPNLKAFKSVITEAWNAQGTGVSLDIVPIAEWDGGYDTDPTSAGLDVFVFDALFLQYFNQKGWLYAFDASEINDLNDFVPFAIDGVKDGATSKYLGLPQFGCSNILFYREGDSTLANADTLGQIVRDLGQCSYTSQTPPDQRGIMVDLAGSTTNACNYLDAVESIDGQWPVPLPPSGSALNPTAVTSLQSLFASSSWYNATDGNLPAYQRGAWFGQGIGRAMVGFTESMSAMGPAVDHIDFKVMPMGDDPSARPLFYSDIAGVNPKSTKLEYAKRLANLIASEAVNVAAMGTKMPNGNPQYLMPARKSIFTQLGQTWPAYNTMYTMVLNVNPLLFVLDMNDRSQLNNIKSEIKSAVRADYPCGCDEAAGQIFNQTQAQSTCPQACASHGDWNGQWRTYPTGQSYCGCDACPLD